MLKEKQIDVLGKTSALTLPVVTRWGSHYSAMKALIFNERCMQLLVLEKREALRNGVGKKPGPRATADKMMDLCTDSGFWSAVKTVMKHIGPLLVSVTIIELQRHKLFTLLALMSCSGIALCTLFLHLQTLHSYGL